MPSKLRKAIGAMKDQTSIGLARVTNNNSSSLDVAILKATTHEAIPIKEKHVKEILLLTSGSQLYASTCAHAIAKRIGRTHNWIVALKSLMLVLRIFQDGNPYFPREVLQAMKGGAKILNLSTFRDISTSKPWDYTAYVRTFALYLNDRLECYLIGKLQRRAVHNNGGSHKRNDLVCDMKPPMLLDRISHWQQLLDRIIATRPTGAAKTNRLVHISLYSIVQESFDLYRDISDGLTLLLDSFFHLQYQSCVEAFQTCIRASKQYEELSEFYSSCKNMGVGRTSEYPSVQKISDELIEALREFLKDQGSFSAGNPRSTVQQPPLMLPAPPDEGGSETGSQVNDRRTSLEDLISVTDSGTSHTSPSISTDQDQIEKETKLEDMMGLNNNTSMDESGTDSGGMDLVLFADDNDQQPSVSGLTATVAEDSGREGWEDILAETATDISVTSPSSSQEGFAQRHIHQPSYNPFLQDTTEIAETSTTAIGPVAGDTDFFSLPTFQATPTFTAQESEDTTASPWDQHVENDPFAPLSLQTDQILVSSTGQQQPFLREQQLWLQHQSKIIARHANVA